MVVCDRWTANFQPSAVVRISGRSRIFRHHGISQSEKTLALCVGNAGRLLIRKNGACVNSVHGAIERQVRMLTKIYAEMKKQHPDLLNAVIGSDTSPAQRVVLEEEL